MGKLRAVGYVRLSREDYDLGQLDESESITNQKSFIKSFAKENGWELQRFYVDEDLSGSDRDRPQFNEMITAAYAGKFDIIIVKKQSRFARDLELVEKYILREFIEIGIRFISILDNIDTAVISTGMRKTSQISGLVDQWYLEDASENIQAALKAKIRRGESIASFAPYGYLKDPKNKNKFVIDPETAPIVKRMGQMYLAGYGFESIAKTFNAEGIPNPYAYKKSFTKIRMAKETDLTFLWRGSTIAQMLSNEVYIGNIVQGRFKKASYKSKKLLRVPKENWVRVENCHEPIFDSKTWNSIQELRSMKNGRAGGNGKRHPLSGKVFCGKCGGKMVLSSISQKHCYYKCTTRMVDQSLCTGSSIDYVRLEKLIIERLRRIISEYLDEDYQLRHIDTSADRSAEIEKELEIAQTEIEMLERKLRIMYEDRLAGVLSLEEFVSIKEATQKRKEIFEEKVQMYRSELKTYKNAKDELKEKKKLLQAHSDVTKLTTEIVNKLIKKVVVSGNGKEEKTVEIMWNF